MAMLAAETGLVNALARYSHLARTAEGPRALRRATDDLVKAFDEHLPRIFRDPGLGRKVAPAIFLGTTAALGVAIGIAPALEVRMETADGVVHHRDNLGLRMRGRRSAAFEPVSWK